MSALMAVEVKKPFNGEDCSHCPFVRCGMDYGYGEWPRPDCPLWQGKALSECMVQGVIVKAEMKDPDIRDSTLESVNIMFPERRTMYVVEK